MPRVRVARSCLVGLVSVALAITLASATAAAAELYKWTDDKGIVHYSDTPPAKDRKASQRVHLTGTESPTAAPASPAGETGKPGADGSVPVSAAETQEKRKRLCDQERATLELLQGQAPLADATSGKALEAKERADRQSAAQRTVAMYCQKAG